jgi:hypothetical protein
VGEILEHLHRIGKGQHGHLVGRAEAVDESRSRLLCRGQRRSEHARAHVDGNHHRDAQIGVDHRLNVQQGGRRAVLQYFKVGGGQADDGVSAPSTTLVTMLR